MASPNVDLTILQLEHKVAALEKHVLKTASLPSLPPLKPRNFRNTRGLFNALESAVVKLEVLADEVPHVATTGRSHIHAALIDYDPGEAFRMQMTPRLKELRKAAEAIAKLTKEFQQSAPIILEQTVMFEKSIAAEADLISKASTMPKPAPSDLKSHCSELVDVSAEVAEFKYDFDVRSPLKNHAMAMGDAAAALGWVVHPSPLKHVRNYKAVVKNLAEDILSRYIDLGCNPVHSDFAEALNAIMDTLVAYVEKEHPAGLRWNYAQGATPLGYRRVQRNLREDSHPIGDFYRLMHGGLTEFVLISRELGDIFDTISGFLLRIYEELALVIEAASAKTRPRDDMETNLRMLLMPVRNQMKPLGEYLDALKTDKFASHILVFREFLSSLNWCTATIQKVSSVGYIIDVEAVTLLYVKKLEQEVDEKYGQTFVARLHKRWAMSVRKMLCELKEYVKMHHPNELMFDTRRRRESVDELIRSVSLSNNINRLKEKSTTSKWRRVMQPRRIHGRMANVNVWVKQS